MARINLRPWREERSQERQKSFLINLCGSALFAGGIVLGIGYYFDVMQDRQLDRNNYLKSQAAKLDKKLEEIKELKEKKKRLLERLDAIQNLQASRPLIVRNFDELVKVLPNGVYYSSITRKSNKISIKGLAEDKLDVSNLMRNIETSIWFGEPSLSKVKLSKDELNDFALSLPVIVPKESKGSK
ncbi:PilN domain-containing protein [Neptuniibacter sp. QD72_48]|uniref:PilN domain-containing protein n=1 Tax=unclassified Neptuniibacter TaxID=2630693 RepID=UPI0039F44E84